MAVASLCSRRSPWLRSVVQQTAGVCALRYAGACLRSPGGGCSSSVGAGISATPLLASQTRNISAGVAAHAARCPLHSEDMRHLLACSGLPAHSGHMLSLLRASLGHASAPLQQSSTGLTFGSGRARGFATEAKGEKDKRPKTGARIQLSKAQRRNFQGNIRRYKLMGGRPEFHNVDRNRYGRIFEPWHTFEVVITSSKNNCWVTVKNKGRRYRCVFTSHAGNVGMRKANRKTEMSTERIALNVARKLKRLGVVCCEVTFRKIMKVETCLQAFAAVGLQVTRLTHVPRLPQGDPAKPRKQRRV